MPIMQRNFTDSAPPTIRDMLRAWDADGCVQRSSATVYLQWIKLFRAYIGQRGLEEQIELTLGGARRFAAWYDRHHDRDTSCLSATRSALYALSRVYQVMGKILPVWQTSAPVKRPASVLLKAYADHLARHRGNPENTVHAKLSHIRTFLDHLTQRNKTWRTMSLRDIDEFLIEFSHHYARSTTADIAGCIRSFTRFLLATGRISMDLADSIISPVQPKYEHPRPSLPWKDVQRLLRSIDRSTTRGLRNHALLLLMSTYGFGAGEVTGLQLQDIDWSAGTLKVVRPKTGVTFTLPLLPAIAKVLARYLRNGRPSNTPTRHLFVQMKMPFGPLSSSSAVRHILIKHARLAGIDAPFLGSHVLRHSNAARQLDTGTRPRVLSDLLGHRDPTSVSAYVRIATESLREISLPVPT